MTTSSESLLWVEQCLCLTFHHTKSLLCLLLYAIQLMQCFIVTVPTTVMAKILLSGEKMGHDSPNLTRIRLSALSSHLQLDQLLGAPCRPFFKIMKHQTHKFLQIVEGVSTRGWTRFLSCEHGVCEMLHCVFPEGDWFPLPLGSPCLGLLSLCCWFFWNLYPAVAYQSTMWTCSLQL